LERPLKSLTFPTALCGAVSALLWTAPASAADCERKQTALDTVICENAELRQLDTALTKLIGGLYLRLNSNNGREFATIVADQLRWRESMWRQCAPLSAACLLPKYRARRDYLEPHPEVVASELYLQSGIKIGGTPLDLRTLKNPGVYLGENQIAGPTERIDVAERYTDSSVDALAFVANRGGNGSDCGQYPVYIAAVRPDVPPEVLSIPSILGNPKSQQSCIDSITRIPDGMQFEIGAWPWVDGRTYAWKPKGGLFLRATTRFAPQSGTRIGQLVARSDGSGRLNNEEFYEALRKATTALDLSFADAAEAFWFSWRPPYREGDYVVLESCSKPGGQDACTGNFVAKAVYERRTDRIFFAFSTVEAPPDCNAANGRDPFDAALRGVQFFPPRVRWQPQALAALKTLYCPRIR
jgi:uncharacterized protein